jgi:SPP1 gp7 family putative phage head morphogenesis protein
MMNKKSNLNHLDYWSERSDEIFRYLDRKDIDFFAELNKVYQEQANEMQKAFYDFVSKYSENGSMSYQEALQHLKGTDLSDYRENARKYREQAEKDPELLKRLNEQYTTARATRLESLQLDMLFRAGIARGLIADKFESYLQKMALMGYKKSMSGRTGTINEPALKELVKTPFNGYNYSQQLWGNTDNLVKDLKRVLKTGFVRGDHPRTMARDLAQKYKVANSRAETLVRTDGTMIVNRSAVQRYKDAGLKYYRILVHLDNRTTEICKRIHAEDKRYLIDEMQAGVNAPPFHFNCRSGVIPDEEELNGDITAHNNDFVVKKEIK